MTERKSPFSSSAKPLAQFRPTNLVTTTTTVAWRLEANGFESWLCKSPGEEEEKGVGGWERRQAKGPPTLKSIPKAARQEYKSVFIARIKNIFFLFSFAYLAIN